MKVICVTGNKYKFAVLQKSLATIGLELDQYEIELDEIQSKEVNKIAERSALEACERTGTPVITTDAGCEINAHSMVSPDPS